nr:hypothetical protein [Lysinibacillus timonensis]
MNKDLEKFKRAYERLCKQFNIEPNEAQHPFQEVLSELEVASKESDAKQAEERMRRLQRSKQEYFRKVDPQSRPLRERIFLHDSRIQDRPIIEKKRKELEQQFREILRTEPNNAVVRYRYGYFLMEEMNFSRAIRYFEEALRVHNKRNCTVPLEEAQKVKAHMYIGFCGGQLLKESLDQLGQIEVDFESFDTEGRTMTKALLMVMNEREQYYAIVNGEKRAISLTEYLRYKEVLEEDCLFISEVEGATFIKLGEWRTKDFPSALSRLIHVIMQEITSDGYVTVERLQELLDGRNTADSIRRNIDRIHEQCKVLKDEHDIELFKLDRSNPEAPKVKLILENYIYVYRETEKFDFTQLNIDEEE